MTPHRIEDWLPRAYATSPGCPPPETYLAESLKSLSAAEREHVLEHAVQCPACAAERDLARVYDESPEEAEASQEDVDFVVARLRGTVGEKRDVIPIAAARPRRSAYLTSRWGMAAAAAVVLVALATFTMLRPPAPSLPTRAEDPVMRGQRVEIEAPMGTLDAMPKTLRWKETPRAQFYRVRLLQVDETVLWGYTVTDPYVNLPDDLLARLHPAVTYFWEVEALDSSEARIAWSDRVEFRVRPAGGLE